MIRSALLLTGLLALTGCGGGGTKVAEASPLDAMVGTWTGSYGVAGHKATGTITVKIATQPKNNNLSGSANDFTRGEATNVSGVIADEAATPIHPRRCYAEVWLGFADPASDMMGFQIYEGTASLNAQGKLIIVHDEPIVVDGKTVAGKFEDFVLTRV